LQAAALERGVSLAVRGNMIVLSPPLVISQEELQQGIACISELLPS
jgi:4-aminobutyrate aminotransferase-like enzyme